MTKTNVSWIKYVKHLSLWN